MDRDDDPFGFDALDLEWLAAKPGAKWGRHRGALAAWVADMDFPPAPPIVDALRGVIDRADFGYPNWPLGRSPMLPLFAERMQERYGWEVDPERCRDLADVIQGVRLVLYLLTRPEDGIVLHTPAYPPFLDGIHSMNRHLIEVRAHAVPEGWEFDYEELEWRLRMEPGRARVWVLCHPHNPLGHVFATEELTRIAELAERHDLIVVSDEIHADLVYEPHRHVPLASLGAHVAERTVTVTSASKAFNLAGLRWAVIHLGPAALVNALGELPSHLLGAPNLMGVNAARAAWTEGGAWLDGCRRHLDRQRHRLAALVASHLPGVEYRVPSATYLSWLDCRALGLDDEPAEVFRAGGVELSAGPNFGAAGHGFVRLNFATSGTVLEQVVGRMVAALEAR